MLRRMLEVAGDGQYLSIDRGFLVLRKEGEERGRVPLDDIGVLIGNAHGLSFSANAMIALAERGAPTILCGSNHMPAAVVWPVEQHHEQASRVASQTTARLPARKRVWRQLVQQKIREQAAVLKLQGTAYRQLERLVSKVRPGDPSNIEAQAARHYWRFLFGKDFRRDPDAKGINSLLNYGYAILRSVTARAVVASGFHPSMGLFHRNPKNSFQLVDDLMEPFRPMVDLGVVGLWRAGARDVDPDVKKALAMLMYRERRMRGEVSPLSRCIERTAISLGDALQDPGAGLEFPEVMEEGQDEQSSEEESDSSQKSA